ncbi:MAG: PorP/SprF family type IX secretion system membrane protein [Bacteroidetes bacterium]|nr:PorP/SprF family type IX secretion system membrane protein [Bacteroidota bacterium]
MIFILPLSVFSQDIHFSQFYAAPLLLNPALTGYSGCKFRFGLNYRNQWGSFGDSFDTQSAFADTKIKPRGWKNTWLGVGAVIFDDNAGSGNLRKTSALVNAAYNLGFTKKSKFFVTIGGGAGIGNRSVNFSKLVFDDQWTGFGFNTEAGTAESFTNSSHIYWDLNAGLIATYENPGSFRTHLGAALHHINKPKDSFYGNSRMGWRWTIHAEAAGKLSGSLMLEAAGLLSLENGAMEIVPGLNVCYPFRDVKIYLGIWCRILKDIIPVAGFEYKRWRLLFSYDLNISPLHPASGLRGGPEFSLGKTFRCRDRIAILKEKWSKAKRKGKSALCPAYH